MGIDWKARANRCCLLLTCYCMLYCRRVFSVQYKLSTSLLLAYLRFASQGKSLQPVVTPEPRLRGVNVGSANYRRLQREGSTV